MLCWHRKYSCFCGITGDSSQELRQTSVEFAQKPSLARLFTPFTSPLPDGGTTFRFLKLRPVPTETRCSAATFVVFKPRYRRGLTCAPAMVQSRKDWPDRRNCKVFRRRDSISKRNPERRPLMSSLQDARSVQSMWMRVHKWKRRRLSSRRPPPAFRSNAAVAQSQIAPSRVFASSLPFQYCTWA